MTRLYLNSRGLYATGPDSPAGYTVPASHACGPGCRIGWHVFPEPYHVETCANCSAVIEREGTEWVHRDGGSRHCWPHGERQPRATTAAAARTEALLPDGAQAPVTAPGGTARETGRTDYSLMPDSAGVMVAMGDRVTYHGSLSEAHGTWTYTGPCTPCCPVTEQDGELVERRMRLTRKEGGGTRPLLHVSVAAVTREGVRR